MIFPVLVVVELNSVANPPNDEVLGFLVLDRVNTRIAEDENGAEGELPEEIEAVHQAGVDDAVDHEASAGVHDLEIAEHDVVEEAGGR